MGAKTKTKFLRRLNRWRLKKSPLKVAFLLFLWLITMVSEVRASGGNLKNTGTINDTGVIRLKNQAIGLPANINGTVEYFGTNQTIPEKNYNNLAITGTGINNTTGGANFTVNGDLTIASTAQLAVESGKSITLGGNLVEQGYLSGSIQKIVDLTSIPSSNFGGVGATLSWTGTSPGLTTVKRTSGVALNGGGSFSANQSIMRYYDVALSSSGFNGTFVFQYDPSHELNSLNENTLELWRSTDGGASWRRQGGTVNTSTHTITKTGILAFSRWTASDAVHPLGPSGYEWVAQNIIAASGGGQTAGSGTNLPSPFVVTVTDVYGNLMSNIPVTFSIAGVPGGATGQALSVTNTVTNASGQASTVLHLGSVAGAYSVTATSGTLTGSPVTFNATATGAPPPPPPPPPTPVATSIVQTSGNGQVDTVGRQLAAPFRVTVLDQFGSPFVGTIVNFAITAAPTGANGQQLSSNSVVTGAGGQAAVSLTLGRKIGDYTVVATSASLPGASISFNATAIAGRATTIALVAGDGLTQAVKTTLTQPFIARTVDAFGNPVGNIPVMFAIDSIPLGAIGQSLTNTNLASDNNGYATTILTLGDKTGAYRVSATSAGLIGSPLYFRATANSTSVPATIVYTAGDNQSAQVRTQLTNPLVVTVLDQNGNPVAAQPVKFAIASAPAGAVGAGLSETVVVTDLLGRASSNLTMGTKVGTYLVTAGSDSLQGSPVTFRATAVAGRTMYLALSSGNNQSAVVRTTLPLPLVVAATDTFGNAKQGVSVSFAITQVPVGASGQVLSNTNVVTGSDGTASTRLTLGDAAGSYEVSATSGLLLGSPVTFAIDATPSSGVPSIVLTAGDAQHSPVSTALASPFIVTVRSAAGNVVAGVPVAFTIIETPSGASGQRLVSVQTVTDSLGRASALLVLGNRIGLYRVAATSGGLSGSPVIFTASADPAAAATLALVSGLGQAGSVRSRLQQPFVVTVQDGFGNPVSGTSVTFAIDSIPNGANGQSFDGTPSMTVTTDAAGLASAYLTLGNITGIYRASASSSGLAGSPIIFRATAVGSTGAVSIVYTAGDSQTAPILTELATPLVTTVLSASGNPVVGQTVVFAIDSLPAGASGQTVFPSSATTDTSGHASTVLRLGNKLGTYRITASAAGLAGSPVLFRAVATLGAARSLAYLAGDGQTKQIGSTLDSAFVVQVFDAGQNPVPGVAVKFTLDSIPSGATGQVLTVLNPTTDGQGKAAAILTLGNLSGVYKVSASSSILVGSPVEFRARATGGLPRTLLALSGDGQSKTISSTLDNPFIVRVLDQGGNALPGVAIQFALDSNPDGATGQRLTVLNSTTDAQGQASALLTLGSKVGTYVVSASSPVLAGTIVKFTGRAVAGQAAAMALTAGNEQTAYILAELPSPFIVTVLDSGGNPVTGANVQFAIDSIPVTSVGQKLRIVNSTTDVNGQASAFLTFGNKDGRYSVLATVTGLAGVSVRFGATATVLVGDVNANDMIDIADLTTVVDHILGKTKLVGNDSSKADFNKDGRIDILDVVAMRNFLLAISPAGTTSAATDAYPLSTTSSLMNVADSSGNVSGEFVLTDNGVRFNLTNSVPVKGVQVVLRFKAGVSIAPPDVIFDRAIADSFYYNITGTELRVVAYNMKNVPIAAGDGPLFRLPMRITDVNAIELGQVIVSKADNALLFDQALASTATVRPVKPQELPTTFILYQNYPNPFNERTKIDYAVTDVAGGVDVKVQVFNSLGEKVKTLVSGRHAGGRFTVTWDGTDERGNKLSSGAYYYRLISGTFLSAKKMILLK